ncbi:MAG: hypothetical protein IT305_03905 [Chloroflexi bacterium]|nr:hypothetical protein [Chloroflexota bacterium]
MRARQLTHRLLVTVRQLLPIIVVTGVGLTWAPSPALAAPPPGTYKQEWVVSREEIGSGFNSACFNLDAGNWAGHYKQFQIQEGWIYHVKSRNSYNGTVTYYRWNRHGQVAPYDVVRSYSRYECDPK